MEIKVMLISLTTKTPVATLIVNSVVATNKTSALIFDPSVSLDEIKQAVAGKVVEAVVLTHAHWDHILTLKDCLKEFNCPLYLHPSAKKLFNDPYLNCAYTHGLSLTFDIPKNTKMIELNEKIGRLVIGEFEINYYYTPGHSDDSLSFILQNNLICGDSVRLNKLARTGLPTSSVEDLEITNIFFKSLDENLIVFNGHDQSDKLKNFYICRQEKTL